MADYKAQKGNIQLTLDNEAQAKAYQDDGYDILQGDQIVLHGKGKAVSYEKFEAALNRIEELEGELEGAGNADTKALKAEIKALKTELESANKEIDKLSSQTEDEEEFK